MPRPPRSVPPGEPGAEGEPLHLLVFGRTSAVHPLPSSGRLTIGRSEANDVCIDDASVSRTHAVLHVGPPLRIEDVGSANGTFVPRARALATPSSEPTAELAEVRLAPGTPVEIAPGDAVSVGATLVVVRRGAAGDALALPGGAAGASAVRAGDRTPGPRAVVVEDEAMRRLYALAARVAQSAISVLILGETGVGKEVLAESIHRASPRRPRPFVALHCAALSETLLESELFGHEKGAFTGAVRAKAGLFESADGGTVFLDEMGELPLAVQVKLLRVIEEKRVLPVGAVRPRSVDVRFVAATHRDLEAEVARGRFREDLYFRLNGISLRVPALRERRVEIAPLAARFIAHACEATARSPAPALSAGALAALSAHEWPGNVRELRNVVERAVLLCDGDEILPEHVQLGRPGAASAAAPVRSTAATVLPPPGDGAATPGERFRRDVAVLERGRILDALEQAGGNQSEAAKLLGVSRRTLISRLDQYAIARPRKKHRP